MILFFTGSKYYYEDNSVWSRHTHDKLWLETIFQNYERVIVVCPLKPKNESLSVPNYCGNKEDFVALGSVLRIKSLLKDAEECVLSSPGLPFIVPLVLIMRWHDYVVDIRGNQVFQTTTYPSRLLFFFGSLFYRSFHKLAVYGARHVNAVSDHLLSSFDKKKSYSVITDLFLRDSFFEETSQERVIDFIFVGSMNSAKNIPRLSSILEWIVSTDYNCVVVGSGPLAGLLDWTDGYDQILRYEFKTNGEVEGLMKRSKFLILTSHNEGMPRVAIEAQVCGCHILSSRLPAFDGWDNVIFLDTEWKEEVHKIISNGISINSSKDFWKAENISGLWTNILK